MSLSFPVYLVSLEQDVGRRAELKARFPLQAEAFILVDAVDGRKFLAPEYFGYISRVLDHGKRLMMPGEVGCSLSHIEALKRFLDSGHSRALILEDDVIGNDHLLERVERIAAGLPENSLFLCGGQEGMAKRLKKYIFGLPMEEAGLYRLAPFSRSYVYRTCCYVVTRKSAERILSCHARFLHLADAWGEYFRDSDIDVYYADILSHPDDLNGSHLQQERDVLYGSGGLISSRRKRWITRRMNLLKRKWAVLMCRVRGEKKLFFS